MLCIDRHFREGGEEEETAEGGEETAEGGEEPAFTITIAVEK